MAVGEGPRGSPSYQLLALELSAERDGVAARAVVVTDVVATVVAGVAATVVGVVATVVAGVVTGVVADALDGVALAVM
jgi:hypothetical protein